ncbi:outer dynein arm-docking complex subunit 4 [Odontesthes bonariensis]|uniref:outer dynein arm-docking complex subunit 4 n=1 Tax=Odontesthes bonariensis TaxID=219752 RepID=UPI003F586B76
MSDVDKDLKGQKSQGAFLALVAEGDWLLIQGEFKKAINSFTTALSLHPNDKKCFVRRSKCYMKIGQFESALEDAEASLKGDKSFFEGLYQKAEALYYMGEFEFALVFYHRAQKIRPQVQGVRLGIQKAQEAIENAVGCPSSVKLEVKGDLSFLKEEEEPIAVIQNLTKEKTRRTKKVPKSETITKQLLGEFYSDKKFLEALMKDEDLLKGQTKCGEQLQDIIQSCLKSLDTCTELWTQENPISTPRNRQHMHQKSSTPSEPVQFLLKSLDDIDAELTSGNAEGSLKKAEEVMRKVQRWSEKEVPNKKELLGSLHSCIGNALFDLGDMDKALEHHQKDLELAEQCKLPEAMSRALDNMGRTSVGIGQFAKAIEFWEKKVPMARGGLEKTWLLHEIGCCYLELNHHEEARDYGLRSVAAAEEIADEKWQINANVLVAQSQLKLGNLESSVSHFEKALTHARLQEDGSALNAIQKALDEVKQDLQY